MSRYACPDCGGIELHEARWVDLNTGEVLGPTTTRFEAWCCDCDDTVKPIEKKEVSDGQA